MSQKLIKLEKSYVDFLFENEDYRDPLLDARAEERIRKEYEKLSQKDED